METLATSPDLWLVTCTQAETAAAAVEAEAESLKLINRQTASRGSLTTFMSKE